MKSSELRMGNLVLCNTSIGFVNTIVSVCNLSSDEIVCSYKPTKQFIFCKDALFEPIPLTEGWLLDFGFYAKHHHDNFSFNGFEISSSQRRIDTNERSVFYLMLTEDSKFNIRIEHVHQLQNLYFALTGEELK